MNLKPWFLIKSGYYIVPSPSTALTFVDTRSMIIVILISMVDKNIITLKFYAPLQAF